MKGWAGSRQLDTIFYMTDSIANIILSTTKNYNYYFRVAWVTCNNRTGYECQGYQLLIT